MMLSKIIAVDFDGTLCENKWPDIGEPNYEVINYCKEQKRLYARLILWTCRDGNRLKNAVDWCHLHGLEFDAVNENLPDVIDEYGGDTRKISATEYIDDKMCTRFKLPFVSDIPGMTDHIKKLRNELEVIEHCTTCINCGLCIKSKTFEEMHKTNAYEVDGQMNF